MYWRWVDGRFRKLQKTTTHDLGEASMAEANWCLIKKITSSEQITYKCSDGRLYAIYQDALTHEELIAKEIAIRDLQNLFYTKPDYTSVSTWIIEKRTVIQEIFKTLGVK